MKKSCFAMTAVFVLGSAMAAASAADLPGKALGVPPAPPSNWSGFYVGGNVGGAWGNRSVNYVLDAFSTFVFDNNTFDIPPQPSSFRTSGVIGGLQVGYNWQFHRNWLIGQESDFNWSGLKGSGSSAANIHLGQSDIPFTATADEHIKWFGTFRARFGYLPTDNFLAYVTGGFAYGNVERTGTLARNTGGTLNVGGGGIFFPSISCTGGVPCYSGSSNDVAVGWTLGGGLEYAVWQRWTLKAEYLYVSLDSKSFTETSVPAPGSGSASLVANFGRTTFNVGRVGVNYRF
jgi:outer membrane immunogenic protein